MVLDLKTVFQCEGESVRLDYSLDLSGLDISGLFPFKAPADIKGEIKNKTGIVFLEAAVGFIYAAPCDRCAAMTETPHKLCVKQVLVYELAGEDNGEMILCEGMKLNADDLFTAEILLSLPQKHLCKTDCRGICVTCGASLNDGDCGCPKENADPRLEKLKQLLN